MQGGRPGRDKVGYLNIYAALFKKALIFGYVYRVVYLKTDIALKPGDMLRKKID